MPAVDSELTKWLRFYDPLFWGDFDFDLSEPDPTIIDPTWNVWQNWLMQGMFWTRILGGYNARRRKNHTIPRLSDPIVGTEDGESPGPSLDLSGYNAAHPVSTDYIVAITSVGAAGEESGIRENIVQVVIDSAGDLGNPIPNAPQGLHVVNNGSPGGFLLKWGYAPEGEGAAPDFFNLYWRVGDGDLNYTSVDATVAYVPGKRAYSHDAGVLAGAGPTRIQFAARSRKSALVEEKNRVIISATGATAVQTATVRTEAQAVTLANPSLR